MFLKFDEKKLKNAPLRRPAPYIHVRTEALEYRRSPNTGYSFSVKATPDEQGSKSLSK